MIISRIRIAEDTSLEIDRTADSATQGQQGSMRREIHRDAPGTMHDRQRPQYIVMRRRTRYNRIEAVSGLSTIEFRYFRYISVTIQTPCLDRISQSHRWHYCNYYASVFICRITDIARPSVRASVCPMRSRNSLGKKKTRRVTKINVNAAYGMSNNRNRCANFQFKRSKISVKS